MITFHFLIDYAKLLNGEAEFKVFPTCQHQEKIESQSNISTCSVYMVSGKTALFSDYERIFSFQVSLISEGCVIITWQRNTLLKVLRGQNFLKNIFDSIIGQDVAKKLFKSNQVMCGDKTLSQSNIIYHIIEGNC